MIIFRYTLYTSNLQSLVLFLCTFRKFFLNYCFWYWFHSLVLSCFVFRDSYLSAESPLPVFSTESYIFSPLFICPSHSAPLLFLLQHYFCVCLLLRPFQPNLHFWSHLSSINISWVLPPHLRFFNPDFCCSSKPPIPPLKCLVSLFWNGCKLQLWSIRWAFLSGGLSLRFLKP